MSSLIFMTNLSGVILFRGKIKARSGEWGIKQKEDDFSGSLCIWFPNLIASHMCWISRKRILLCPALRLLSVNIALGLCQGQGCQRRVRSIKERDWKSYSSALFEHLTIPNQSIIRGDLTTRISCAGPSITGRILRRYVEKWHPWQYHIVKALCFFPWEDVLRQDECYCFDGVQRGKTVAISGDAVIGPTTGMPWRGVRGCLRVVDRVMSPALCPGSCPGWGGRLRVEAPGQVYTGGRPVISLKGQPKFLLNSVDYTGLQQRHVSKVPYLQSGVKSLNTLAILHQKWEFTTCIKRY